MTSGVHVFTSITANYLPKARVLAASVKRADPTVSFHLVLSDSAPVGFELDQEPFDSIIFAEELVVSDFASWAFGHSVVELCTAVKGLALEYLFTEYDADQVFFFDPDIVVFSRLDELQQVLSTCSVLLTPHLTIPESTDRGVQDNEMASLIHGVFNLGFVAVRNTDAGRQFSRWWRDRLLKYCHDDKARGIFTDQKWVNLAPCFFDDVHIVRSPGFNVATWNISNRHATGSLDEGIFIDGEPLGFYHFSGFDSGDQATMLEVYGQHSPVLTSLRQWYIQQCEEQGQSEVGSLTCRYDLFSNGDKITQDYRILYRQREDLRSDYPNPYMVTGPHCYKAWFDAHPTEHPPSGAVQIAAGTPLGLVFDELAQHIRMMMVAGRGRSRSKRFLMKVLIKGLRLAGRIMAPGK